MGRGGHHHGHGDPYEDHEDYHDDKTPCPRGDDDDHKSWTPKPDDGDEFWGAKGQRGEHNHDNDDDDDDDGMSDHQRMKIIAATVVVAAILIVALIVIIVVCCKKKAKRTDGSSDLKKKNPFQTDPEKAMQKPSAKEIEANQSAPPMLHTLPVVVKPVVVLDRLPTDQKGEKIDYTAPPPEDPRQEMTLWSPPPTYIEKMPNVN